jgi:Zn-dependent peptidase ImmA (M78 family)/transcriptional regulator with XRE-family HTH domain
MPFNPTRLSIARQRRLLNKKGFADLVGVTPHTATRWEQGSTVPTDEVISQIARVLEFPVEFFLGENMDMPDAGMVSFRSQKAMTAGIRDAALAAGAIGFLISDWIEQRFDLPQVSVPDLDMYEPDVAAMMLRQSWALGNEPVSNMVHLLESKGVRVFSLAENSKRVNAFSLWRDEKPYVFLNTMKTAENSRFDAAHELGHLVLHQDGKTTGRKAEEEANQFASEFLMPRADMLAHRRNSYAIEQMIQSKKRWRVSLLALTYRIHKLGFVSDWRYRDLCIQIASRFKQDEPEGIDREKSVVWQKVMKTLWSERITQADIARALHLPVSEVNTLIFGILYSGTAEQPVRGASLSLVRM